MCEEVNMDMNKNYSLGICPLCGREFTLESNHYLMIDDEKQPEKSTLRRVCQECINEREFDKICTEIEEDWLKNNL